MECKAKKQKNEVINGKDVELMKKNILVLMAVLVLLTFTACGIEKPKTESKAVTLQTVELSISKDNGKSIIYKGDANINAGDTAYSVLARIAKVETQYGGTFVSGINDIKSASTNGKSYDWFYSVNGVEPNKGSKAYKVKAGDKINWDYHSWK